MSDFYVVKAGDKLLALDEATREAITGYGDGEIIRCHLYKDRNPRHHRLFFGLLQLVFENQEKYLSQEALRFALTIQAGYVDEIRLSGDKVALRPKSIAWGKMDQHEFDKFYAAAMKAIPELLPQFYGVDMERWLVTGEMQ